MTTTSDHATQRGPRPARAAWPRALVPLFLIGAAIACGPTPTVSPYTQAPPAPPPEERDPLEVRAGEPRAGDLAGLLEELGVTFQFWEYQGPACAVRFQVEVRDDRIGGGTQVVAEDSFDLVGPEARLFFILMPPPTPEQTPIAIFGTDSWGERSATRAALPALWFGEAADRALRTTFDTEPFRIEDATGRLIVTMFSDRVDDATGPQRVQLDVRLSVLAPENR